MTTFELTASIDRRAEEVFAFLAEPVNLPRWQLSLIAVRPHRHGPLRPGVEVTETRHFLGRIIEAAGGATRFSWTLETGGLAARLKRLLEQNPV
jgi:hypothetical protein